jgi:hypothetical protein
MHPTQQDVTAIAVLVSQYLNGILIGQVERDIQVSIFPCNNNLPVPPFLNGLPVTIFTICANQQSCFTLQQ